MPGYKIFWGDSHDNRYQYPDRPADMDSVCRLAQSHLDFYPMAYYTPDVFNLHKSGLRLETRKDTKRLEREWAEVEAAAKQWNAPGGFVTFPGYEWQGDGTWGDHNVFHRAEGAPLCRAETLPELYECIGKYDAYAIPHHTAYYPGMRSKNWDVLDEALSPFTEIFSVHGSSETDEEFIGLRGNRKMGPGAGGETYEDALARGLHVGAICSTDNWGEMPGHYGHGLMACLAPELTRDALWEAFGARRVYGVTGDRIRLDFTVNGAVMGGITKARKKQEIRVKVEGADVIDRIEVLRGSRVIATYCHQGKWDIPSPGTTSRFKMRVEAGWGPDENELNLPPREWHGALSVADGRMLGSDPCWISGGQKAPVIKGQNAEFEMLSTGLTVGGRWQNANIFEFEAEPGARLSVQMNGLEATDTVERFARASRILWFRDECMKVLETHKGLAPGETPRDDIYYHLAYKAKLHRAVPEAGYKASFAFEDDVPVTDETWYRVRVEQRNGQKAWSSPVWVDGRSNHI